jgi:hypothetical protein
VYIAKQGSIFTVRLTFLASQNDRLYMLSDVFVDLKKLESYDMLASRARYDEDGDGTVLEPRPDIVLCRQLRGGLCRVSESVPVSTTAVCFVVDLLIWAAIGSWYFHVFHIFQVYIGILAICSSRNVAKRDRSACGA